MQTFHLFDLGHSHIVTLLLNHGASTAILDLNGNLFECEEHKECQKLIEQQRKEHTNVVMSAILGKDALKKTTQVFTVSTKQIQTHRT